MWTASTGAAYTVGTSYQGGATGNGNQNITGSPDYGGRMRIVGDIGSGCGSDPLRQFTAAGFAPPLVGSVGLESGADYLRGCFQSVLDMSIARNIRFGEQSPAAASRRRVQRAEPGDHHRPEHDAERHQPDRCHGREPALRRERQCSGEPFIAEERRLRCRQRLSGAADDSGADPLLVLNASIHSHRDCDVRHAGCTDILAAFAINGSQ